MSTAPHSVPPAKRIATPGILAALTLGVTHDPGGSWLGAAFCALAVFLAVWGFGFLRR